MKKKKLKKKKRLSIKVAIADINNYIDWIRTIKAEERDENSLYNKLGIKRSFFTLYKVYSLSEEFKSIPENALRFKVIEAFSPVHKYLDMNLRFGEYVVPEFNRIYDDDNNPTLSFVGIYRFAFKKLSILFVLKRLVMLGIITWAAISYNTEILELLKQAWTWFRGLI